MDHNCAVNANVANPNENEQPRRVLDSYTTLNLDLYGNSIVVPIIAANNFELKPQLVTLVQQNCQYHGLSQEDPNQFISNFLQICDTVKINGVNPEVYKLMLFPFAVRDRAKLWLDSQPKESLDTWDKVVTGFLSKFFSPQKLTKLSVDVQTFRQRDGGSLYMKNMLEETTELIELVANNQYLYSSNRNLVNFGTPQKKGILEVETMDAILAQNKVLAVNAQNVPQEAPYDINGSFIQDENYDYDQFPSEQDNYIRNAPRNPNNDPYAKTYNQG
ncbi:uncharacterized protein LOC130957360 [Arachis stenosperma]|uniref:uncharacterized protein LOC130957360 n=1 Tax=Arachis stenosperma TaxID=217475 RepID=UPI0025AC611D|nr:uncharacterized protein LOC130957360 [Arachis stenosperma]